MYTINSSAVAPAPTVYDKWKSSANHLSGMPSNVRDPPPQAVPLTQDKQYKNTSLRAPKECDEAVIGHLWHLTSDVLTISAEFETKEDLDTYLLEIEDPVRVPAKYVTTLSFLEFINLLLSYYITIIEIIFTHIFLFI